MQSISHILNVVHFCKACWIQFWKSFRKCKQLKINSNSFISYHHCCIPILSPRSMKKIGSLVYSSFKQARDWFSERAMWFALWTSQLFILALVFFKVNWRNCLELRAFKFYLILQLSGRPIKTQVAGPPLQSFWFSRNPKLILGWGLRICFSNKFPNTASANIPGSHFEDHWTIDFKPYRCKYHLRNVASPSLSSPQLFEISYQVRVGCGHSRFSEYHREFWCSSSQNILNYNYPRAPSNHENSMTPLL